MIRFYLRKTGGKEHQLIVRLYALWGDSFSCRLLFRELKQLYSHPDRKEPPGDLIEYRDFSKWQNDLLRDPDEEGIRYWADRCVGLRATVLPFGRRDAGAFSPVQRTIITFAAERLRRLRDHCSAIGVGPADLLLASFGTYLGRFAENDFVVGLIPFFRSYAELNGTVGLVNKTLPVPFRPRNQEALESEAARVARVSSEAIGWGDYFHTGGGQECSSEYFSCCFEYIDLSETQPVPEGDPVFRIGHFETGAQPYLLKLNCLDDGDSVEIALSYDRSRIVKAEADLLDVQLAALFRQLERGEELIATPDERETAMLDHFSCSSAFDLLEQTVVSVFERQVEDTPDHTAIVAGASRISYRELNRRANQLARYLIVESGVRRDEPVAIRLPRDEWVIVAMLGIMKAGGAYLPIEPDMPAERVESILSSSGCKIIIDNERLDSFRAAMEGPTGSPLYFEENPGLPVRADDLAYIIYTSGSTGAPKGVMIPHRAVTDYVSGIRAVSNIGDCSSFALVSGFSADLGYTVLYASLLMGGELTILPGVDMMADENIIPDEVDCIKITPSHWKAIRRRGRMWLPAKCLVFGGERLTTEILELIRENSPRCRVYNHYGPTETAIGKLLLPIEIPFRNQYISVGRPFGNTRVYVLDEALQLVPIGMTGEICVGGSGLARGYLNDSELTARKFIAHPFAEGERLYRTGDRGRWLADGTVEFLGRTDDQVKIRGYRVEPGEIENALQQHPAIDGAVVVCRSVAGEELQLVAYCYGRREELTLATLTGYLSAALPSYMIPAVFVILDKLPLTANGKVDRKALPDPEGMRLDGGDHFEAPVSPAEQRLAAIWGQVLSLSQVGRNDHFFDLGGHSLKATRLASQIQKELGVKVKLRDLLSHPVLRDQARLVAEGLRSVLEPIPVAVVQESYVLSSSQRRLWVLSQLEEGSRAYHMPVVYRFEGDLDVAALERAFNRLIERHEVLRTVFISDEGEPRQVVIPAEGVGFQLMELDIRSNPERAASLVAEAVNKPFDLSAGPLLRAGLYRIEEGAWIFCCVLHHIVSDGWSMGILVRELLGCYVAYRQGLPDELEALPIQYKDYAVWQQAGIGDSGAAGDRDYWLGQLSGELPVLDLPLARPRSVQTGHPAGAVRRRFSAELLRGVQALGQPSGSTLFMTLTALVEALLYRYSGQAEMLVGTPVAGREHPDLENQIGFYLNTLVLRLCLDGSRGFGEQLPAVRSTVLEAFDHQRYPFDDLVGLLEGPRVADRHPLFDVMVVLQNTDTGSRGWEGSVEGLRVEASGMEMQGPAKFDLLFVFQPEGEELSVGLEYNSALFDRSWMEQLLGHLVGLAEAVVKEPLLAIDRLALLSSKEENFLLNGLNDTEHDFPRDKTLVDFFNDQCRMRPEAVAVVDRDGEMCYEELERAVNRLAAYLMRERGVKARDRVAVCLERGREMIVSVLAVLRCGAAYVPIDPGYPAERVTYMCADSGAETMIDEGLLEQVNLLKLEEAGVVPVVVGPEDPAYIIYTSGSTGLPKGCMLEHRGLVNRLQWMWTAYGFRSDDRILQKTTFTFDVSVWEIFLPLCWGATLVLCPGLEAKSPVDLLALIERQRVSCLHFVPAMLQAFLSGVFDREDIADRLGSLRLVFASGEALAPAMVHRWYGGCGVPLHNLYGPTEASVDVTYFATSANDRVVPIGRPIWNTQIYVLSGARELVPFGVRGEICIGGVGLARGYSNNAGMTAERFIASPFRAGERLYRTGDLGRWLPDGNIEYLGRMDNQVKLRGYRIELGEIEAVLERHDTVGSAVVVLRTESDGGGQLVAYVTGERAAEETLREYAGRRLPAYMVPSSWVRLESMPLTSNGKVDRKALPGPVGQARSSFGPPVTETERQLAGIWEELLGRSPIGRQDDFFHLGGHSLKATRLAARINKIFEVTIELRELFTRTVLADQAEFIDHLQQTGFDAIPVAAPRVFYPLSSSQRRLWTVSQLAEASIAYNVPGAFFFDGALDPNALRLALEALIDRHEILRTVFKLDEQGEPAQCILAPGETRFPPDYRDLRGEADQQALTAAMVENLFSEAFDLAAGPLLRAALVRLTDTQWVFAFTMHHLISDGWSMDVLIRELLQLYAAQVRGEGSPLRPLPIQYKDYACWQQEQLAGGGSSVDRDYWLEQLGGELPVLAFTTDRPRPATRSYRGATAEHRLPAELTDALRQRCGEEGATLFMGLVAGLNALLYRYTGQQDIIIGSQIAGRQHADLEDQIGAFVNTLALRTRFKLTDGYQQLLGRVRSVTLDAYVHQDYPFDMIIEELNPSREASRNPLFDISAVLHNMADSSPTRSTFEGVSVAPWTGRPNRISKFDLAFNFTESAGGIDIQLLFNTDLFDPATAQRLLTHLDGLLRAALAEPAACISSLRYLRAEETDRLLFGVNSTCVPYPREQTIVGLFRQQAQTTPDNLAVADEGVELSYKQLDRLTDRLAGYLRAEYEIGTGDFVGILLNRSADLVVAILGILKCGAAYVPIDPDYPRNRKELIIADANIRLLLTDTAHLFEIGDYYTGALLALDAQLPLMEQPPVLPAGPVASDLAYLMYTSGSTGIPKGVMVEHRSVVRLVCPCDFLPLSGRERLLSTGSVSFDATTFEYWSMLLHGGRLYFCGKEDLLDETRLAKLIERYSIDTMWFTAGWLSQLVDRNLAILARLKNVVAGGDKLSPTHIGAIRRQYPDLRIINGYGPTENTTFSLTYAVGTVDDRLSIPIGKPINNSSAYILDDQLQLCGIGVPGEICVGGAGLARGYLNDSELTARKFIAHPFAEGERLYRTGDRGRWLADGTVEFLGRTDDQVKIRGYRVEPGEIENALQQHPAIDGAVVVCRSVAGEELQLVAYCYGRREELTLAALTGYLSAALPSYMIPAIFVVLDQLPLNANGKIDRGMLPDPEGIRLEGDAAFETPVTSTQRRLAAIWQHLLSVSGVGLNDHFFDLGGHSLKATRLASQIHKEFGVKIDLRDLFAQPVLRDQARLVTEGLRSVLEPIPEAPVQESYVLSSSQQRLWVMSQLEEGSRAYHMPAVYQFEGELDEEAWSRALTRVVERHEILRTVFEPDTDGQPRQRVLPMAECGIWLERRDLRDSPQKARGLVELLIEEPFDLTTGPLLRAGLYRTGQQRRVFCFVLHHLISDGWSMGILVRELLDFYQAYRQAVPDRLEDLRIQYKDYAVWQQGSIHSESLNSDKAYWLGQFADGVPEMEVSTRKRPAQFTYQGDSYPFTIGVNETAALLEMTRRNDGTLFMSLLFFVNLLLFQYTGKRRILVGTSIAGRDHIDLENQVGFYLNNVALITEVDAEDRLVDYYDRVKSTVTGALLHQRYPLELLIEEIDYKMDPSRPGLFNVLIELHNESGDLPQARFEDIVITEYTAGSRISHFDLIFDFQEVNGTLACSIVYCTDLFDKTEIHLMKDRFLRLVKDGVTGMLKNKRTGDVGFRAAEKEQQIAESHLKFDLEENF